MLLTSHELNMQQAIPNPSRTKKHQQFSNSEKEEVAAARVAAGAAMPS